MNFRLILWALHVNCLQVEARGLHRWQVNIGSRWWLGAKGHQAITSTNVDPILRHQMASLGQNAPNASWPQWKLSHNTIEILLKTHKFCHITGTDFTESILSVMKNHLPWETTKFSGYFIQISQSIHALWGRHRTCISCSPFAIMLAVSAHLLGMQHTFARVDIDLDVHLEVNVGLHGPQGSRHLAWRHARTWALYTLCTQTWSETNTRTLPHPFHAKQ